ncbi:MAG: CBS domain containing-hemolysin-like protein [Verrucomicrobiales bacterium]|jgi:CBS domain containing-hemolysin-like protein
MMCLLAAADPTGSWGLLISLVFSFLCSIAEAVLLSVTRPYIQHLKQEGDPVGDRLADLKKDVDRPLAAILTDRCAPIPQ